MTGAHPAPRDDGMPLYRNVRARRWRSIGRGACVALAAACDPVAVARLRLAPVPAGRPDSASVIVARDPGAAALEIAERLALRHQLVPVEPGDALPGYGGPDGRCFARPGLRFCGRVGAPGAEFYLQQYGRFRVAGPAAALRRELVDGLHARFGPGAVRATRG